MMKNIEVLETQTQVEEDEEFTLDDLDKLPIEERIIYDAFFQLDRYNVKKQPDIIEIYLTELLKLPCVTAVLGKGVKLQVDFPITTPSGILPSLTDFEIKELLVDSKKLGYDLIKNERFSGHDARIIYNGFSSALETGSYHHQLFSAMRNSFINDVYSPPSKVAATEAQSLYDWIQTYKEHIKSYARSLTIYELLEKYKIEEKQPLVMEKVYKYVKFDEKQKKIISKIEDIVSIRVPLHFCDKTLATLENFELLDALYDYDEEKLEILKTQGVDEQFLRDIEERGIRNRTLLVDYAIIAKKKLNINVDIKKIRSAEDFLQQLTVDQRNIILIEFENIEKYQQLVKKNNCPHVALLLRMNKAKTAKKSIHFFFQLGKFFNKKEGAILCNNCNFYIMCPHMETLLNLQHKNSKIEQQRIALQKYVGKSKIHGALYCKFCGERVFEEYDYAADAKERESDPLQSILYNEVMQMLQNIKYKIAIDETSLIEQIIFKCRPRIEKVESFLLQSRTSTEEYIRYMLKLYSCIYVWAYIVHLVEVNSKNRDFSVFDLHPDVKASVVLSKVFSHILTNKNIILNKTSMQQDSVKKNLLIAYNDFKGDQDDFIHYSNPIIDAVNQILLDPIFAYIANIWQISRSKFEHQGKRQDSQKKFANKIEFVEAVLGIDVNDIMNVDLYDNVKFLDPNSAKLGGGSINNNTPLTYRFFGLFLNLIQNIWKNKKIMEKDADFAEFTTRNELLCEEENKQIEKNKLRHMMPVFNLNQENKKQYKDQEFSLCRVFDENGERQNWDIYVYSDGKKNLELTKDEIANISFAEFENFNLIDMKSSKHDVFKSKAAANFDGEKTIKTFANKTRKTNFFEYYENRCPEGEYHELKKNICIKCGFGKNSEFYKKYYPRFEKEQTKPMTIRRPKIVEIVTPKKIDWKFNKQVIAKLAGKLKIDENLIWNIESTEDREYDDIVSGKIKPDVNVSRIMQLNSVIYQYIEEFGVMLNIDKIYKPNPNLVKIKNLVRLPKMEQIYDDFDHKFESIQYYHDIEDQINFLLEKICIMSDRIIDAGGKYFVEYVIKKILRSGELLSKPTNIDISAMDVTDFEPVSRDETFVEVDEDELLYNIDENPIDDDIDEENLTTND